jgi:hypothetical protein
MRKFKENITSILFCVITFFVVMLSIFSGFFVNENRAIEAVQVFGFSNSKIIKEHRIFSSFAGCDKHDSAGFTINTTNLKGENVNLLVCCGLVFKGCTVRY